MTDLEEIPAEDEQQPPSDRVLLNIALDRIATLECIEEFKRDHVAIHSVDTVGVIVIEVGVNNGVTTPYTRKVRYYTMGGTFIGEVD